MIVYVNSKDKMIRQHLSRVNIFLMNQFQSLIKNVYIERETCFLIESLNFNENAVKRDRKKL